ncbi:DUF4156 domain-containing protein [Nitrosospira sp. Nsp1]|uniref:DUF4156 domain-containing protein n=1 Tax=Nitrosospira sp. Nsp1 TaxID=136547 RepID=UPI00087E8986|nr:DUF4156 domain-containing protein [Nitrosospira sp. Nsp1]SCX58919.1 protein of unknown function [Nitrosospira sp. Nsp1]
MNKIGLFALLLLTSCAAQITEEGLQVRQLQNRLSEGCEFIGIVQTEGGLFYSSKPEATRDMLNKVRNETANLGGNAFTITTVEVERGFSLPFAQADAYICPRLIGSDRRADGL